MLSQAEGASRLGFWSLLVSLAGAVPSQRGLSKRGKFRVKVFLKVISVCPLAGPASVHCEEMGGISSPASTQDGAPLLNDAAMASQPQGNVSDWVPIKLYWEKLSGMGLGGLLGLAPELWFADFQFWPSPRRPLVPYNSGVDSNVLSPVPSSPPFAPSPDQMVGPGHSLGLLPLSRAGGSG